MKFGKRKISGKLLFLGTRQTENTFPGRKTIFRDILWKTRNSFKYRPFQSSLPLASNQLLLSVRMCALIRKANLLAVAKCNLAYYYKMSEPKNNNS